MKPSRISLFARVGIVVCVLGAAYVLGLSHQDNPISNSTTEGRSKNLKGSGHLTREQAWQKLASVFGKSGTGDNIDSFRKILDKADPADIPFLLDRLSTIKLNSNDRNNLIALLFDELTYKDPLQTLTLVDQYIDPGQREYWKDRAYAGMVLKDPQLALTELAKLPQGKEAEAAYRSAFEQWAGFMVNVRPDAAITAALALPIGPERDVALHAVAEAWASSGNDPKTAQAVLDWASGLSTADSGALEEAVLKVTQFQPQLAAQYLDKLSDPSARNGAISAIASSMSKNDPAATLTWLDQVATGATYDTSVKNLFAQLAQNDPATGAALLGNLTEQVDRNAAIAQLAQNWSGTDPKDAMAWAAALPATDGAARTNALNAIMSNWANSDLNAAIAFVQNSSDPALLLNTAPTLAMAMAKTDSQAALAWVNELPDGAGKSQALSSVLVSMAQTNFPTAWNYATNLPSGVGRDGAMNSVVGVLAQTDPAQAANLLGQFSTDSAALSATTAVATDWAKQDPQALNDWVNELPAGAERDAALVPLISSEIVKHPSAALALANSIGNEQSRLDEIKGVIKQWAYTNPEAAANAAQTEEMPETQRAALLASISKAKVINGKN